MTIIPKQRIYKQWMLTVLLGSLLYTVFSGAADMERITHELTLFGKLRLYTGCFVITALYSSAASGVSLYLNRIIYYLISCNLSIRNRADWFVFLLFPSLVTTIIYCIVFPFITHSEESYYLLMGKTLKFMVPWILSTIVVTITLNSDLPTSEENEEMNE